MKFVPVLRPSYVLATLSTLSCFANETLRDPVFEPGSNRSRGMNQPPVKMRLFNAFRLPYEHYDLDCRQEKREGKRECRI